MGALFEYDDPVQGLDDPIPFGKYAGTPIKELDPGYISWLLKAADHWWVADNRDSLIAAQTYVDESTLQSYTLGVDQQQASDEICNSLFEQDKPIHRLQGGAGYGKSFAVIDITLRAKRAGYKVRACATSYVATQNLAKDLEPLGVECATIARTLRLDVEYHGPKEMYIAGANTQEVLVDILAEGNLLVVDEYSMVDDVIASVLTTAVQMYGGKLLVVGDVYQLPSPAQDWDSALCHVQPVSTLTIPKRYSPESELYQVEQQARENPYLFDPRNFTRGEVGQVASLDEMVERFAHLREVAPDEQSLMLWFRRVDMVESNRMIRDRIFGSDAPDVCDGEQLRVQRTSDYTQHYDGDGSRVYSGTSLEVLAAEEGVREICIEAMGRKFTIPVSWVTTEGDALYAVVFSVTEHQADPSKRGGAEFNAALKEISAWCSERNHWHVYRAFRNCFVQVAYQYASTIHRVQGMSVDNVLTSPDALRRADQFTARKLQYVGLTRAKKRLICY